MSKIFIEKSESVKNYRERHQPYFETEKGIEITGALTKYIEITHGLSLKGRIDLVIKSLGINPEKISLYNKLLKLTQLVPYVIPNYNLFLLGDKSTSKSTPYKCYSNEARIISGSPTKAELRGAKNKDSPPALLEKEILVFEEIADDIVGGALPFLKETLQSRMYEDKDGNEKKMTTSIVFIGNNYEKVNHIEELQKKSIISEGVPRALMDEAFLDRINATVYLDDKFKAKNSFFLGSGDKGLNVNILMESFKELRKIENEIEFNMSFEEPRDISRVLGTVKGLCKILYPENDVPSYVIEGLINFGLHLRYIGKEFKNPFPPGSIQFLLKAMELDNVEELCLLHDRILVKEKESDYFKKIALSEWGIEKNELELNYFKNNKSNISTTLAHIDIDNSTNIVIKQEYFPLYSITHTYSVTGSLIKRKKESSTENYAENSEFNILLIEMIKLSFSHPNIIDFPKNRLRPWKELTDAQLAEIVKKTFDISNKNTDLKKSNYSYDNRNTFKLINFSEYIV